MAPTLLNLDFDTTTKTLLRDLSAAHKLELSLDTDLKLKPFTSDDHPKAKLIVIVDPYSTGMVLANGLIHNGHHCVCVLSDRLENLKHLLSEESTKVYDAVITHEGNLNHTIDKIQQKAAHLNSMIHHVIAGGELGVCLADQLTHAFGLEGNVMEHSIARRDKYLMGETLRKAGVRAVKQLKTSSLEDIETFLNQEARGKCVVLKPVDSAGSDDVALCSTFEEAKQAFQRIIGKINVLGITNTSVLIQEYLEGDEYVVDSVSHHGTHKVTTIWKYDKRRVNNAAFVYFGLEIVAADNPLVHGLIDYHIQVLGKLLMLSSCILLC
jgi:biotin carboxylase